METFEDLGVRARRDPRSARVSERPGRRFFVPTRPAPVDEESQRPWAATREGGFDLGARRGSVSYSVFHVVGEVSPDYFDSVLERVRLRAFSPLEVSDEAEERVGWCAFDAPLDLDIDGEKLFVGGYLCLGLRIDRWAIPSPLFKARYEQAEKEHLAKKGRSKLRKSEKDALAAEIRRTLRPLVLPQMTTIDLVWNTESGVLRFWSGSPKVLEHLEKIFEETFKLSLLPHGAYAGARRLGLDDEIVTALASAEPAAFAALA